MLPTAYPSNVKTILTITLCLGISFSSLAQIPALDISGDAQIRGSIDIHHTEDSTSILIGKDAGKGYSYTTARKNTFVGAQTGGLTIDDMVLKAGTECSFFGFHAGYSNTANRNSFFGSEAGSNSFGGHSNSFIGSSAGIDNIDGSHNSFFGREAGIFNTDGNNNTYLGALSGQANLGSNSNAIAIGYLAKVGCDNCAVLGGTNLQAVKVGIGVSTPSRFLTLYGSEVDDEPDMAITSNDALIELGQGKQGPHGITFGDQDDNGMKMLYRTGPNELSIETGTDIGTNTSIVVFQQSGEVGIGTSSPNDALDVVGDIDATGCIQTDNSGTIGGTCLSDRRLKKNIEVLDNQLQSLTQLNLVTYNWKTDRDNHSPEIGLIAQEVEEVIPAMVITETDGTKKIRYDISLSIRMIKALQEQQAIINNQASEIDKLKKSLNQVFEILEIND